MNPSILMLILRVVIALVLYVFLAVVIYFLWRDIRSEAQPGGRVPITYLSIQVDGKALKSIQLEELNLIGRSADCTISLEDDTVSAHHARLSYQGKQWWLEDLGSKNGTIVNGFRLEDPIILTDGDLISIGQMDLLFTHTVVDSDPVETIKIEN